MSLSKLDTNGMHRHTTDGVPLTEGLEVVLTGKNWADDGIQGETRRVEMYGRDAKVEAFEGFSLYICGKPGGWDDWTVTSRGWVDPDAEIIAELDAEYGVAPE